MTDLPLGPIVTLEERTLPAIDQPDAYSRRHLEERRKPYLAAVVPPIAEAAFVLDAAVLAEADDATKEVARFDEQMRHFPAPFAGVLLRTESASSSQIEHLAAGARAIAEAAIDERAGGNGPLIMRNVRAMQAAIELSEDISHATIIEMHRQLLESTAPDIVGRYRDEQVWIGGRLPHHASYVAPHHERVMSAMSDLVGFAGRTDLPVLAQTAIAHAQFETIHPFPDGNGRTGRALVQSMLRHAGVIKHVTIPISAGLLTDLDGYIAALTRYRDGDAHPIVSIFSRASLIGVSNARQLSDELRQLRAEWNERLSGIRRDAAAHRLADALLEQPVITAGVVEERLGVGAQSALNAIGPLVEHGILHLANSKARRGRVWVSQDVIDALDAFAARSVRRPKH